VGSVVVVVGGSARVVDVTTMVHDVVVVASDT
jgi:hypothetical protein